MEVGTSKPLGGGEGSGSPNNKPKGCSASGAYTPGPDEEEEVVLISHGSQNLFFHLLLGSFMPEFIQNLFNFAAAVNVTNPRY